MRFRIIEGGDRFSETRRRQGVRPPVSDCWVKLQKTDSSFVPPIELPVNFLEPFLRERFPNGIASAAEVIGAEFDLSISDLSMPEPALLFPQPDLVAT